LPALPDILSKNKPLYVHWVLGYCRRLAARNDEPCNPESSFPIVGLVIMLSKRIIPCLDVKDGKTTKGIRFQDNRDIGDPVQMARFYYEAGADEIVFYDITASSDRRDIMIDVVKRVAQEIFIPFSVGGGIRTIDDMRRVLLAGAEKVSVNTAAVLHPKIIAQGATAFGSQCIVLGMDVKKVSATKAVPSGYEVVIHGGRTPTGMDALSWAQEAEKLGTGEICLNSIDTDGTQEGYEVNLTALISESVGIPVIASGGAGSIDHIYEVFTKGKADAALVASIVHYDTYTIRQIKQDLHSRGVKMRMTW
jgi:cyclase